MPKQLKEIRGFIKGTVLNASERDVIEDASIFALNINPESESGILSAINTDELFALSSGAFTYSDLPIPWGHSGNENSSELGAGGSDSFSSPMKINLDVFQGKDSASLSFKGTKGRNERLTAVNPRPYARKLILSANEDVNYKPASTINPTDTEITILSEDQTITGSPTDIAISGFTEGVATITVGENDPAQLAGDTFTITTPDNRVVIYKFYNDGSGASGTQDTSGGTWTRIDVQGESTLAGVAAEIETALNSENGHRDRITVTRATALLNLQLAQRSVSHYLTAGTYFSLIGTSATYNVDSSDNTEIMRVVSTSGTTIRIQRGLFGTKKKEYTSAIYDIYANKYLINDEFYTTDYGYCNLYEWSSYSGNNIGGSGRHWLYSSDTATKAKNGYMVSSSTYEITFSATDKTIKFKTQAPEFNEGDNVSFYMHEASSNHGYSGTILKTVTDGGYTTWTMDTAPVTDVLDGTDATGVFVESSLIKNCTLFHSLDTATQDTGADKAYKINDWVHQKTGITNVWADTTDTEVSRLDTDGYWKSGSHNDSQDLNAAADNSENFYPFQANPEVLAIECEYEDISLDTDTVNAIGPDVSTITLDGDASLKLATGNIIKISTEYMRVLSINNRQITVARGYNSNAIEIPNDSQVNVNVNHTIKQSIDKSLLKRGQEYCLYFYSKSVNGNPKGALSLTYNGGSFSSNGKWNLANTEISKGYIVDPLYRSYTSSASNITQETRWINFSDLDKPNGSNLSESLDTTWRRFKYEFTIPKNLEKISDLDIEFSSSLDADEDKFCLAQIDLLESTLIYNNTGNPILATSVLDNSGAKDLMLYNRSNKDFQIIQNCFNRDGLSYDFTSPSKSLYALQDFDTDTVSAIRNNRELHIGLGGTAGSPAPQWLGYLNHKLFGSDNTNQLYQDEDTVHKYGTEGSAMLSKIALAGEHEYLVAVSSSTGSVLTITHTNHSVDVGDNLIIREWADASNTWAGTGVWVVTTRTDDNTFVCKRFTTLDANPPDANFLQTNGARDGNTGRICYRPYYYYGIREGDNSIFRITPGDRLTDGSGTPALDTEYTAGKIEKSIPLSYPLSSIATCYSKGDDGGIGGGKIYVLNSLGQISTVDVQVKYDEWLTTPLQVSSMNLEYRAFKWSNDNVNGNIGGTTGVFGGLSEESTPSIAPSGIASDILETKGPTSTFIPDTEAINGNDTEDFDTRLWIQYSPAGDGTFGEGDRFLFCGKSNATNTAGNAIIYMADRTPPTTTYSSYKWPFNLQYYNAPGTGGHNYAFDAKFSIPISHNLYGYESPGEYNELADAHSYFKGARRSSTVIGNHVLEWIYTRVGEDLTNGGWSAESQGDWCRPYFNFGHNIGWASFPHSPGIKVAKYGLFPVSDNDRDGVLDGTGVVVPSSKSMQSTADLKHPYGNLHQRVSAHAVGVIGGCEDNWRRRAGKLQAMGNQVGNSWDANWMGMQGYADREDSDSGWEAHPVHEAPSSVSMDKCIFICTDMHYGDFQPKQGYQYTDIKASDNTTESGINLLTFVLSDAKADVANLQAGDLVFISSKVQNANNDDIADNLPATGADFSARTTNNRGISAYIVSVDSSQATGSCEITTSLSAADYAHGDGTPDTGWIHPHTSSYEMYNDSHISWGRSDNQASWVRGVNREGEHLYHYSFNSAEPTDGSIFKDPERAGGHYTKTWYTSVESEDGWWGSPGILNKIDKLNFRAGYMMRPFDTSENTFENLIVGNYTAVDSPSMPDTIYHLKNSNKLHYHVNNSAVNNQFANRLFIASPTEEGKSNVYICDLNFMYPDEGSYVPDVVNVPAQGSPTDNWDGFPAFTTNSNTWNRGGDDWDVLIAGKLDSSPYISTAVADHPNATLCPVVAIDTDADDIYHGFKWLSNAGITHQTSRDGSSSCNHGDRHGIASVPNRLAGACLTIVDQTTGTMQTRQIVGSRPYLSSEDPNYTPAEGEILYLDVHYPFGHAPAANDYFYIWSHADVCTAPVRLLKETPLPYGLPNANKQDPTLGAPMYPKSGTIASISGSGSLVTVTTDNIHFLTSNDYVEISDTVNYNEASYKVTVVNPKIFRFASTVTPSETIGNWKLLPTGESSAANPMLLDIYTPTIKTTFGGLDMRKLRGGEVSAIADDTDDIRLTSANHRLSAGDSITHKSDSTAAQDGTYIVKVGAGALPSATEDTFDVANTTSTNTPGDWTTNQWESVVMERGNQSKLGEIRSGFNSWDKGNIAGNIARYDTDEDASSFLAVGDSFVEIKAASETADSGDYFLSNNNYHYKISLIYDGYQEGPLSDGTWIYNDSVTRSLLSVSIKLAQYSKRLSHVCIYRKDSGFDLYKLVKEIKTDTAWSFSDGAYKVTVNDDGELGASYEARTGMSELLDTIQLKYGMSTKIDGYLFAADCSHKRIKKSSNLIFRSRPGMFSVFDYVRDYLTLDSKPTALANFNGRLYAFDANTIYRINQQNLAIEDFYEGVGCINKDAIIVTEYGMFFADKNGAYFHDGSQPIKISQPIHRGGDVSTTFGGTDNIKDVSWDNIVSKSDFNDIKVTYDSNMSSILFIINYLGTETDGTSKSIQYIWSYHVLYKRWDLWELSENSMIGKPFHGDDGSIYIPINNAIFKHRGGSEKRDYTWVSKKITAGEDSVVKVFNRIKLNAISNNVNLGGSNMESSDRLLLATNEGTIASSDVSYTSKDSNHSEYKISSSNKRGRWLQFKLENMTEDLDSVGIIFRKKAVK